MIWKLIIGNVFFLSRYWGWYAYTSSYRDRVILRSENSTSRYTFWAFIYGNIEVWYSNSVYCYETLTFLSMSLRIVYPKNDITHKFIPRIWVQSHILALFVQEIQLETWDIFRGIQIMRFVVIALHTWFYSQSDQLSPYYFLKQNIRL